MALLCEEAPEPGPREPALLLAYVDEKYLVWGFSPDGARALLPEEAILLGICLQSCHIVVRLKAGGNARIGGRKNLMFELDKEDYQYAFVSGNNTSYLWLLSRTPEVSDQQLARFKTRAKELGFDTDALIHVRQE